MSCNVESQKKEMWTNSGFQYPCGCELQLSELVVNGVVAHYRFNTLAGVSCNTTTNTTNENTYDSFNTLAGVSCNEMKNDEQQFLQFQYPCGCELQLYKCTIRLYVCMIFLLHHA